jgi:hypothetical protein
MRLGITVSFLAPVDPRLWCTVPLATEALRMRWSLVLSELRTYRLIDRSLHDLPHLTLGDVRIVRFAVARRPSLPRMYILDRFIAKSQRYKCPRFSRQFG